MRFASIGKWLKYNGLYAIGKIKIILFGAEVGLFAVA